ncbi:COG4705 family protein [Salinisphaera sp. RV14]|uniref:COG4705 family protein n=1 Tax=unclassified Salinisphaera TaxID=2649847 RepID=UPI003F866675
MPHAPESAVSPARNALVKVPEITIFFWIVKLLTTAMGESTSDFLVYHINPYVAVVLGTLGFVVSLALQFVVTRYIPWVYWLVIVMIGIFGTMVADVAHIVLGVPYFVSTAAFAVSLVVIFALWARVEGTLSIHSIHTTRREIFYWAAIIATFALGTAAGDMTATTFDLGYFDSTLVFTGVFILAGVACALTSPGVARILLFWLVYVLTRPVGASCADWLGKSHQFGGMGYGDGVVSVALGGLIVVFVAYLTVSGKDRREEAAGFRGVAPAGG